MPLHELTKIVRRKRRRGRGIGSSRGSKSGRGMKGQRARAGSRIRKGFEGGQTPLYMRLPKARGASQRFSSQAIKPIAIRAGNLRNFPQDSIVGPGQLRAAGFTRRKQDRIKIIAGGQLQSKLTVRVHAITAGAKEQIEQAGGKVELILLD